MCQFELPTPRFVERLATLRRAFGSVADQFPLVDIRATAALCQTAVKLCETSKVALIVVNHVRKSVGRDDIGSAQATVELRLQFRYPAAAVSKALGALGSQTGYNQFAPADHGLHRLFQTHRATGHRRTLPRRASSCRPTASTACRFE